MHGTIHELLDELAALNELMATPGAAPDLEAALARRRALEEQFERLDLDDYVEQARRYAFERRPDAPPAAVGG